MLFGSGLAIGGSYCRSGSNRLSFTGSAHVVPYTDEAGAMNKPQSIQTPSGEEMVVLPRAEYEALITAVEDLEDALAAERSIERIAAGETELIPDTEVDAYLDAPTPLAFWRRKRGLTQAVLAEKVEVTQAYLSEIEGGKKEARIGVLRQLAGTLKVTVDQLVG